MRESLTISDLIGYLMNNPQLEIQKNIPLGYHGMEYSILFHESVLTIYQDYVIDNRILFPGTTMV